MNARDAVLALPVVARTPACRLVVFEPATGQRRTIPATARHLGQALAAAGAQLVEVRPIGVASSPAATYSAPAGLDGTTDRPPAQGPPPPTGLPPVGRSTP